jgi:signal transduction histidine kinase
VEHSSDPALVSVRTQVDRLARLTADLRKLADLETQPVEREPVELSQVLSEVIELTRERRHANDAIRLNLPHVPWPLPPVAGDRDLIFLALHNVVDNACKFCGCDDTIEIRAYEDGRTVAVDVADTGPGVKDDELPHLGEELYRGSTTRSIEGSGLGLALVQAIVKRHGGAMSIRSRLGQGTLVTLRFPTMR